MQSNNWLDKNREEWHDFSNRDRPQEMDHHYRQSPGYQSREENSRNQRPQAQHNQFNTQSQTRGSEGYGTPAWADYRDDNRNRYSNEGPYRQGSRQQDWGYPRENNEGFRADSYRPNRQQGRREDDFREQERFDQQYGRRNNEYAGSGSYSTRNHPNAEDYKQERDRPRGGVTNMGGIYDNRNRQHTPSQGGRQGSSTYPGGAPNYGTFDRGEQEGRQDFIRSGEGRNSSHWGGRYGMDQTLENRRGSHEGPSGYDRNWRQQRGDDQRPDHRRNYSGHSSRTNTGNEAYDRGSSNAPDYWHNRHTHEHPQEQGFLHRAGDRLRSWFGGHDEDRNR